MTDFEDRLASIAAKRQEAQPPKETASGANWSSEPDLLDQEMRRDLKQGVIGAFLGVATVLIGGIATVAVADMQDWDWRGIAIPPGSKLGAFGLGLLVFCIAGLMMERMGRVAMVAGFAVMLVAEPRLAQRFPETWIRIYELDLGMDHGERVAELYVTGPDAPRDMGPTGDGTFLGALLGEQFHPVEVRQTDAPTEAAIVDIGTGPEPAPSGKSW